MTENTGCIACDLLTDPSLLPGGPIASTDRWSIEHCVGPLGVGTFILKPTRHVTAIAMLSDGEARELGPLLRLCSRMAAELTDADQVYNTLWSHSNGVPGHVHYVIQPVSKRQIAEIGSYGPALQMQMFTQGKTPSRTEVEALCNRARTWWDTQKTT